MNIEKRNYRIDEFSKIYGICRTKVYQEFRSGRLKSFKSGKTTLISREAAESWQKNLAGLKEEHPVNKEIDSLLGELQDIHDKRSDRTITGSISTEKLEAMKGLTDILFISHIEYVCEILTRSDNEATKAIASNPVALMLAAQEYSRKEEEMLIGN